MKPENPYLDEILNALEQQEEKRLTDQLSSLAMDEKFEAGFADRVMNELGGELRTADSDPNSDSVGSIIELRTSDSELAEGLGLSEGSTTFKVFRWFAAAGVAAAVILLTTFLLDGDSLSIDAMSGLAEVTAADELTLELY